MKTKNIKLFSLVIMMFLFVFSFVLVFAKDEKKRFVDNAGLLDTSEYASLSLRLNDISERHGCDVVIVTEKSIGDKSPEAYADDYFDYNGYGIGDDRSGILLLINMADRDWHISTSGYCMNAFTDVGMDFIANKFLPDLKDKDYENAFEIFINQCDKFIIKWKADGTAYDKNNLPKEPLGKFGIIGSIVIGVVASWLTVSYMKNQLKSVLKKSQADDYVRKNSLHIKNSRDIFLYSNITRSARSKSNSGSSTHRSSFGRVHGGRGGKF